MSAHAWMNEAACTGLPTEWFFPETGRGGNQAQKRLELAAAVTRARAVCAGCPVQARCLDEAEEFGIWGGTTEDERLELRRTA